MQSNILLRTIIVMLLPFIFMFGFYVLFHGKISPGGGFQGGAICASALILHALIFGANETERYFSQYLLRVIACIGAIIYVATGFASLLMGGKYLEYNAFFEDAHLAQFVGVMTVELGVHLTVFACLSLIFLKLAEEEEPEEPQF